MVSQSRSCREALVASFPATFVVSDFRVCTLDMVLEMAVTKVGFRASLVRTFEQPLVCVRSDMVVKSHRPIEAFVAVFVRTLKSLLSAVWFILLVGA